MYSGILWIFIIICCIEAGPSFIKPCSISDPKLNECALRNANDIIPIIIKGDKEFKIPNLAPVQIPLISIDGWNMLVKLTDVSSNVLSQVTVTKMNIDDKAKKWSFTLKSDVFDLSANYEIKERILVFAINDQGLANVTYDKPIYTHTITYREIEKDGSNYLDLVKSENELEFQRVYYKFDNLFGGDKRLGDEMNEFLNENREALGNELYSIILETVGRITNNVYRNLFAKVPKRELFLP